MTRIAVNGIHLNVEDQGTGPALLMLHGFTGDVSTWEPILPTFAGFRTIRIDLIGHGGSDSPAEASRYSMAHAVQDIIGVLDQLGVKSAALLGYSLGGRVALHLATAHPERFWALILESASPGIETQAERDARIVADNKLADDLLRDGIEAFVDRWQAQALFASQLQLPREVQANQRAHRVAQNPIGQANSLRGMGAGTQDYLLPLLSSLPMPTFLTAGALDSKYTQLTQQMAELIPGSAAAIVPEAGHAVHLEQPESFERMLGTFLMLLVEEEAHERDLPKLPPLPSPPLAHYNSGNEAMIMTSTITPAVDWQRSGDYEDILYDTFEGIAKITINRPHVRNAFRPLTVTEMQHAFRVAHEDDSIGVVILTGAGDLAFCSGGDQKIRGDGGYVGDDGVPRLNVLELQRQIRLLPKPVVAMVAGYAIGGGHVLHMVCDLTIAADNAIFGQTGPKVGSFDAGYGATLMARIIGHKKAREIWYLCRQYNAQQALDMGLINTVVPLAQLEAETVQWCKEMLAMSPTALRFLKASFNADTDGLAGIQQLAGDATLLYYLTEEAKEGRDAFVQKRKPDFSKFPKFP